MMMKSLQCQEEYTVECVVLSTEDGQVDESYNISSSNLFHAIEIGIKASSSSNSSTQKITNDTVKNLKHYYRKKLVVDYMNSLDQTKAFVVNLKKAILILHEAWEDVKEETIKNCFKKAAIIPALHGSYVEENLSSDSVL